MHQVQIDKAREIGCELATALTSCNWRDDTHSYNLLENVLSRTLKELSELNVWGPDNRLPSSAFWDEAGDLLRAGDLLFHARSKPRGYAGDFEMLEKICHEQLCEHPLGRLLDRFFQNQHAPRAVRNRTRMVSELIVDGCRRRPGQSFHVVSVGSGPAMDIRWALEQLDEAERRRLYVTLVDLDPNALDHARPHLQQTLKCENLTIARENLYRLWQRDQIPGARAEADFVFCTGLLDYLSEVDAVRLLRTLARWAGDGQLLTFNFSPANPTRAFMEWVGNWYLTYRTEADMGKLAQQADLPPARTSLGAEQTGVNLLIHVQQR